MGNVIAKAKASSESNATPGLAAAVWAFLTANRSEQVQAASLDGLEVQESTWGDWEELCSTFAESAAER
jgi:hypothetical protein